MTGATVASVAHLRHGAVQVAGGFQGVEIRRRVAGMRGDLLRRPEQMHGALDQGFHSLACAQASGSGADAAHRHMADGSLARDSDEKPTTCAVLERA